MATVLMTGLLMTWCVGRFTIDLPSLPLRARGDTVQGVAVTLEPIAAGSVDEAWRNRVARIEQSPAPPGIKNALVHRRADAGDRPIITYHHDHYSPDQVTVETSRALPQSLALFTARSSTQDAASSLARVRDVAASFQQVPDGALPPPGTYCVRGGVVALPAKGPEGSTLVLEADKRRRVEVTIKTVLRPDPPNFTARRQAISRELTELGIPHRIIRAGARRLAGLDGEEFVYEQTDAPESVVNAVWQFGGEPGHVAERPLIALTATLPGGEAMLALWDRIVSSLRRR